MPAWASMGDDNLTMISNRAVTLAHHWLVGYRGGEVVLDEFARMFPSSPLMALVGNKAAMPATIADRDWVLSPLQRIPRAVRFYKSLLPFHPWAFSRMRIPDGTELLLTCDAAMAKVIGERARVPQVCYCFSPPRYLWHMTEVYEQNTSALGVVGRWVFRSVLPYLRRRDYSAAQSVSTFVADSAFVAARIRDVYQREAEVVHAPAAVENFSVSDRDDGFYLIVSQLTSYKRVDLAVKAFSRSGRKLVVIGGGEELQHLKTLAGPSVVIMGRQSDEVVRDHYHRCRAFLYPQIEDYGITAVEAQAAGKPVIAFGAGGALETVVDGRTGIFFHEQSVDCLDAAVTRFELERRHFSPGVCRENAERFSQKTFRRKMAALLEGRHGVDVSPE